MDIFSAYLIWFLIGLAFIIAELAFIPAFVLIFFALGAWITSVVVFLADMSLTWQIIIFLVSSIAGLVFLRRVGMRVFKGQVDDQAMDGLEEEAHGQRALVTQAIAPAAPGAIKYRGASWPAVSDQAIPAGAEVVILGRPKDDRQAYKVNPI